MSSFYDAVLDLIYTASTVHCPGANFIPSCTEYYSTASGDPCLVAYFGDSSIDIYGYGEPKDGSRGDCIFELNLYNNISDTFQNDLFDSRIGIKGAYGFQVSTREPFINVQIGPNKRTIPMEYTEEELFQLSTTTDTSLLPVLRETYNQMMSSTGSSKLYTNFLMYPVDIPESLPLEMLHFSTRIQREYYEP